MSSDNTHISHQKAKYKFELKNLLKTRYLGIIFLIAIIITSSTTFAVFGQTEEKIPVIVIFKNHDTLKHQFMITANGGDVIKTFKILNGFTGKLSRNAIEKLRNDPEVAAIDPDVAVKALDSSSDVQIRADKVWASGNTGQAVPVAILDTGIDKNRPEFSGRIFMCHNELTGNNTCLDDNGHGTHVAGIIGAVGINPTAKGVSPAASFYIDKVLDSSGNGNISEIISGIDWAVANKAKVISMSLGTNPVVTNSANCNNSFPTLTSAVNTAVNSGITVVAAAGNSGNAGVGAPGCISSTITVGADDNTNTIAPFSSMGGPLADHGIVAPGVNIFSTVPTGSCPLCDPAGYTTLSGTSMATPQVTGTIALMLRTDPNLTPAQVKNIIFSTACTQNTNPSCPTGSVPNNIYGHGRVDALSAFKALPNFKISINSSSILTVKAHPGKTTITITSLKGFNSQVTLSLVGKPAGVSQGFSLNPVKPSANGTITSTLSLTPWGSAVPGNYTLTVKGVSGTITHSVKLNLVISKV